MIFLKIIISLLSIRVEKMKILKETYSRLLNSYSSAVPPEEGGILGIRNGIVCAYKHDSSVKLYDSAQYVPNTEFLNSVIPDWEKDGIVFAGMVHSHIPHEKDLSASDRDYAVQILQAMPDYIDKLFFPIVLEGKELIVFSVCKGSEIQKEKTEIV